MRDEFNDKVATVHKGFEEEAMRLLATSGRTQRAMEDLGIGPSTVVRWIVRSRDRLVAMPYAAPQADITAELKRLKLENEILRQKRDIPKRATAFFHPGRKSMRFALIDQAKKDLPVHRLCQVLGVSRHSFVSLR